MRLLEVGLNEVQGISNDRQAWVIHQLQACGLPERETPEISKNVVFLCKHACWQVEVNIVVGKHRNIFPDEHGCQDYRNRWDYL